jgi:tRNA pseudouridine55 synthase
MTGARAASLDGALVVDKPAGLTSHDVVAAVRRTLGVSRVGHTGTLDPMATGVLPLLLGRATRLAQFLSGAPKTYEARVRFGWATDTRDATGVPLGDPADASVESDAVERALDAFRGTFAQVPPAYSAKQVQGRRAYALARGGAPVADLAPVQVTVHALALESLEASIATLRVTSSAGFYVRSLAHDLGVAVGTGAHLHALRRVASGTITEHAAMPFERVMADPAGAAAAVVTMDALLSEMPAAVLSAEDAERARHGRDVEASADERSSGRADASNGMVRLLAPDGSLVAIAARTARPGVLHPSVVLR